MTKHPEKFTSYYNLLDCFREKGCPLCSWIDKAIYRYLDSLLYEHVNDPEVRSDLRRSLGFCPAHAACFIKVGDALGVGLIYQDLLHTLMADFPTRKETLIKAESPCPACRLVQDVEKRAAYLFHSYFRDRDFQAALQTAAPLCLSHCARILEQLRDKSYQKQFLEIQQTKMEKLYRELSEFIRKHDYRFQEEGLSPEEADSWKRAVMLFVGQLT